MFELERLNHPTTLESDANCAARAAVIWPCQICRRPRFNGYELADKAARILLHAESHACPDCGDVR